MPMRGRGFNRGGGPPHYGNSRGGDRQPRGGYRGGRGRGGSGYVPRGVDPED